MFELSDGYDSNAVIKVVSVGGGGGNAIEDMITKVSNVDYICANTDLQALKKSSARTIIQLGEKITNGLGAGADPKIGHSAAQESRDRILEVIEGTDMLFIAAGMGGGTGTGAAPVFAEIAKELGILTVAVVTRPFIFEGRRRAQVAEEGIKELSKYVDSLIIIPNDKLLSVLGKSISLVNAFKAANEVLQGAVKGIADLITCPGLINVDFADVRTVMSQTGMAMMGSSVGAGEDRATKAAESAVSSPLLEDIDLSGAQGVLVNISGGHDMTIGEFEAVGDVIRSFASEDAIVVVGTVIDPDMVDEIRVTVVVTGLNADQQGNSSNEKQTEDTSASHLLNETRLYQDTAVSSDNTLNDIFDYDKLESPAILRRQPFKSNTVVQSDRHSSHSINEKHLDIPTFLRQNQDSENI